MFSYLIKAWGLNVPGLLNQNMKFLITGHEGFIGSHLKEKLNSHELVLPDFDLAKIPLDNIDDLDAIFHLAANTDTTFEDDIEMYRNNLYSSINVLQMALSTNTRLIYASSGAVYGNSQNNGGKKREGPLNAYGVSKLAFDNIARVHFDDIPIIGLRFFNVFGTGEERKEKMASMVTQWYNVLKRGEKPKIFKQGAKRDFVYIKDVISAMLDSLNENSEIYDVGTGKPQKFRKALNILMSEMECDNIDPEWIDNPYLGKYQTYTKADKHFETRFNLKKGLIDFLEEKNKKDVSN